MAESQKAVSNGVSIFKGSDAHPAYPRVSVQAKEGSHAFLGNGDSVTF
jgi:hypothetical protein